MTHLLPPTPLLLAYLAASVLLALTPGADMALFLSRTMSGGRAHGFAALAGATAGLVVHTFAAALGLSALIAASARAYDAVKIAGALYLLWLAFSALRHGSALHLGAADAAPRTLRSTFLSGFAINIANPKIVLFFVGFLPQFVAAGDPAAGAQFFALGFGFIAITGTLNAIIVAVAARALSGARDSPRAMRAFDYVFAAFMGTFAARLLWSQAR